MKIWFEHCINYTTTSDCPVKLGLDWYRHKKAKHKLFKYWNGFSITCHFFKWTITLNYVDDFEAYNARINYRRHKKVK